MPRKTLIHLSDLHIGLRKRESNFTEYIFGRLARLYPRTPIIITGDLTDSASENQFKNIRASLNNLAVTNPILTVPGNHDYAWKGNLLRPDGWENWVRYLGSPLGWNRNEVYWMGVNHEVKGIEGLGVWQDGPCVYFGIDSGDPEDKQISARGYISSELADALQQTLTRYANKTRVPFLHHHPFTHGLFTKLHGSQRLLDALNGNCELLLFGHEHEYGLWRNTRGIPLIVSSHKSSDILSGNITVVTVIDIDDPGTKKTKLAHRLEVL